ncbi:MAG: hypothetical protein AAGA65_09180 [Actinomycetota bacterium]
MPAAVTQPHVRKFDVRKVGYNWGDDLGLAINAAIDAAPAVDATVGSWTNAHVVTKIHVPTSQDGQVHQAATKIVIPTGKAVEIVCEDGPASALIEWVGPGDYMAAIDNGQRVARFRNLSLWRGGVEIGETGTTEGVRKDWGIYDCHIIDAPEWAVLTRALSIIGGTIDNVTFRANGAGSADGGDIYFAHEQSDVNVIRDCDFLTCHGTNLRLRTSGVHTYDCDFEQRPAGYEDKPYVHLDIGPLATVGQKGAGDVHFARCRFGNEAFHPKSAVVIGPNDGTVSDNLMNDITFEQCRFRGANGAVPSPTQAFSVLELNAPTESLKLTDCEIFSTYSWFAVENFVTNGTIQMPRKANDNSINTKIACVEGAFTAGGHGWDLGPHNDRHIRPATGDSETVNTLDEAHDLSLWAISGTAVVASTTGPSGAAGAVSVTQDTGNDGIQNSARDIIPGQPMILSVWARDPSGNPGVEGSGPRLRMTLLDSGKLLAERDISFRLSTRWERYWVQIPEVLTAAPLAMLLAGIETGAGGEVVELWGPQLEYGWGPPSPFLAADAINTPHAPRQHQGATIGTAEHGYGTAAPTTGHYNLGDIIWNTAPAAAGVVGWVCVTSGAPGTWKSFGTIEA